MAWELREDFFQRFFKRIFLGAIHGYTRPQNPIKSTRNHQFIGFVGKIFGWNCVSEPSNVGSAVLWCLVVENRGLGQPTGPVLWKSKLALEAIWALNHQARPKTWLFPKEWMKHDETWWNMMKHDETWWNMMKHDETWWNMMKHDETWWNMMRHDETWWNMMKHDETWWNMMKLAKTSEKDWRYGHGPSWADPRVWILHMLGAHWVQANCVLRCASQISKWLLTQKLCNWWVYSKLNWAIWQ